MSEHNERSNEHNHEAGSESEDRTPPSDTAPETSPGSASGTITGAITSAIRAFVLRHYLPLIIVVIALSGVASWINSRTQPSPETPVFGEVPAPPVPTLNATGEASSASEASNDSLNALPPSESEVSDRPDDAAPSTIRLPASDNGNGNGTVFEEYLGDSLEDLVKQADYALYEAMKAGNVGQDRLDLRKVEIRRYNDRDFHYQSIAVHPDNATAFLADFKARLAERVPESAVVQTGTHDYLLSLDGHATHELHIRPFEEGMGKAEPGTEEPRPYQPPEQIAPGPKIALVIDDLGESTSFAEALSKLPFPVAFSIWPYSSHRTSVAQIGTNSGNDILVHQPMQPKGWPKVRPGKGALYTNMTRDDIQAVTKKNIVRIPGAQGVNNHMGSKFTEWRAGMVAALDAIHSKGMFFLDSRTTGKSAGRYAADKVGIPLYRRNIFLDNVAEVDAVIHQLRKTEGIALSRGSAIAIGHPHPATLQALKKWADIRDTRVSVVPLTTLKPE